jgi:hypothetical protein
MAHVKIVEGVRMKQMNTQVKHRTPECNTVELWWREWENQKEACPGEPLPLRKPNWVLTPGCKPTAFPLHQTHLLTYIHSLTTYRHFHPPQFNAQWQDDFWIINLEGMDVLACMDWRKQKVRPQRVFGLTTPGLPYTKPLDRTVRLF